MAWLSILGNILLYLLVPFVIAFRWVIIAIGPALHLSSYIFSCVFMPLRFLAKFETIYIYLGVAALIGLITGSILHLSSSVLVSLLNLNPTHEEEKQPKASLRSAGEQASLEKTWQNSLSKEQRETLYPDESLEKKYSEWLEKTRGKRSEDQSLFGQTILEEEDDSDHGF